LVALLGAFILNRLKCRNFLPYLFVGLVAWLAFLNAGIHPTIAGVALGMLIPADNKNQEKSLLHHLEHKLSPWSAYVIMPVFALANAGVTV
ncbi:Na+/H+ antiporter NhaA, partial [Fusobacterium mortiferum]|nr:Na+/H+ antiporter NhaA [Fusobacterium mortiferum]